MRPLLRDLIRAVAWYLCLVVGGALVTLIASKVVGYLPYSDRPGPGWVHPGINFAELWFFISWALLMLPYAAVWALGIYLFSLLVSWLRAPRWLVVLSSGLLAGYVTLTLVAGFGWYIAMASAPVYVAAGLGVVWGAVLIPRYTVRRIPVAPPSIFHGIALVGAYAGAGALIYWLFFFQSYSQQLEVMFVRLVESSGVDAAGDAPNGLTDVERDFLDRLNPGGSIHFGLQSFASGSDEFKARALIVTRGPLESQVSLPQPKAANVIYLVDGTRWSMSPSDAPTLSRRIRFAPSGKPTGALLIRIDPGDAGTEFTWYPPIVGPQ